MRYTTDQIECIVAIVAVALFAAVYLPLAGRFLRGAGPWVEFPAAALPVLLLVAVVAYYWRRVRE